MLIVDITIYLDSIHINKFSFGVITYKAEFFN